MDRDLALHSSWKARPVDWALSVEQPGLLEHFALRRFGTGGAFDADRISQPIDVERISRGGNPLVLFVSRANFPINQRFGGHIAHWANPRRARDSKLSVLSLSVPSVSRRIADRYLFFGKISKIDVEMPTHLVVGCPVKNGPELLQLTYDVDCLRWRVRHVFKMIE